MQFARDPQSGRTKVGCQTVLLEVGSTLPADPVASYAPPELYAGCLRGRACKLLPG